MTKSRTTKQYMVPMLFLLWILLIVFGKEIQNGILSSLRFATLYVIPAVFPFMLFSSFLEKYAYEISNLKISKLFARIIKLPRVAFAPYLFGIMCGFPCGAKCAEKLYREKFLSEREANCVIALSATPSPGFFLFTVGVGMTGSIKTGIFLMISCLFAGLFCSLFAIFFDSKCKEYITIQNYCFDEKKEDFSLINSIKNNVLSLLYLLGCFGFFGGINAVLSKLLKNQLFLCVFQSLLDIGTGTQSIPALPINDISKLLLSAFTLGHCGLCVMLQLDSVCETLPFHKFRYFAFKICVGAVSALTLFFMT